MQLTRTAEIASTRDTIHEFLSLFHQFGTVEDVTYFLQAASSGLIRLNERIGDFALVESTTSERSVYEDLRSDHGSHGPKNVRYEAEHPV